MNDQAAGIKAVIVALPAEIDVANSDGVYEQLRVALAAGVGTVIADMTSTSFCDSSGVRAIMRAHEQATTRDIVLRLAVSPDRLGAPRAATDGCNAYRAGALKRR